MDTFKAVCAEVIRLRDAVERLKVPESEYQREIAKLREENERLKFRLAEAGIKDVL